MRWSKNWYLKFVLLKNEEGGSFSFFFLNLAKNRVLGIFCFFEIVRKVLEREWVIVKFKNILKLTSNFNSHIIKKTFGLIYSFLRGIDWGNLQSYYFIKITRNICNLEFSKPSLFDSYYISILYFEKIWNPSELIQLKSIKCHKNPFRSFFQTNPVCDSLLQAR